MVRETTLLVALGLLTVAAAIQRVGWHSRSHATRLFREYVGVTPGYYRQMRRAFTA